MTGNSINSILKFVFSMATFQWCILIGVSLLSIYMIHIKNHIYKEILEFSRFAPLNFKICCILEKIC